VSFVVVRCFALLKL